MKVLELIKDIFFPRTCVACSKEGYDICDSCFEKIEIIKNQACPNCRKANTEGYFCSEKCKNGFNFDRLIVCTGYEKSSPIKNLIVRFKYKFNKDIKHSISALYKKALPLHLNISDSYLIPAPIHKITLRERGFNQSLILAKLINSIFKKAQIKDCLKEKSTRHQQAHMNKQERLKNLKNSITSTEKINKEVYLIDDIATTCSTLQECSRALKNAGARKITAIVIARGN